MNTAKKLIQKLKTKKAKIAVIGLGYVGLPLAIEKVKAGFSVIGIDRNIKRVNKINRGICYIPDVVEEGMDKLVKHGKLKAVRHFKVLKGVDAICICVPTPLDEKRNPDISYIKYVTKQIAKYLHKGQLVSLESTTYPGTTEEIVLPELEKSELTVGKDFFLCFSPERVDPGNKQFKLKNTPKVVGGVTKTCSLVAKTLYSQIIDNVQVVSSPKIAEMEKLLENVFRIVNIALVDELAMLCRKMKINIWEVIDTAATKPYGFIPFYPGPGIGGHCIPLDPIYLSWKAKEYGFNTEFIKLASRISEYMPSYIIELLRETLSKKGKSIRNSKILVLGVAYKKDINDWRESPSLKIIELLERYEAKVCYNDPYIPSVKIAGKIRKSIKLTKKLIKNSDCVFIVTDHSCYDYNDIIKNAKLIFDSRGVTRFYAKSKKIIML